MCHAYFRTKHVLFLLSPYSCIFLVFTAFMYSYCFHTAHVVLLFSSFPCATVVLDLYYYSSHPADVANNMTFYWDCTHFSYTSSFFFQYFFSSSSFCLCLSSVSSFCYFLFRLFFLFQQSPLFPSFFSHSFISASGLPLLRVSIAERQNRCLRERGADSVIFTKYTSFKQR